MEFSTGIGTGTVRQSDGYTLFYLFVYCMCMFVYRVCMCAHMGRLEGDTGVFLYHFSLDYLEKRSHTELESTVSTRLVGRGSCF